MTHKDRMHRIWTNLSLGAMVMISATMIMLSLVGCATRKEKLLPHGDATMLDVWNQNTAGDLTDTSPSRALLDARAVLRRPVRTDGAPSLIDNARYTRDAENEINRLFQRLPNPDLVMYVFPHLAGEDHRVPVPGYSTVFPFYEHVQYALPGERTESY